MMIGMKAWTWPTETHCMASYISIAVQEVLSPSQEMRLAAHIRSASLHFILDR